MKRTQTYVLQVVSSFGFKIVGVVTSLIAVPLTINYLGVETYGVWSTLFSILLWISFFDLGIGIGLRNRVAESLARDDRVLVRQFVASAYTVLGIVALVGLLLFALAAKFAPWTTILRSKEIPAQELGLVVLVVGIAVSASFWLGLINQILAAFQKTSIATLGQAITNLISLGLLLLLPLLGRGSIIAVAVVYGCSVVMGTLVVSVWFYSRNRDLLPKFSLAKEQVGPLLNVGLRFFVIQLTGLVIFATNKLMIGQLFGPSSVSQYDVLYRLFSIFTLIHGLVTAPLLPAYSDAFHRNDQAWMKKMLQKQIALVVLFAVGVLVVVLLSPWIVGLWVSKVVTVDVRLSAALGVFVVIAAWNNVFGGILGAIDKVRFGSIYTVFVGVINLPVCYLLAVVVNFGVTGIVLGTCISLLVSSVISPVQVYFFLYSKNPSSRLAKVLS